MPSGVQVAFLLEEVREIEYEEMVALSDNIITYLGRTTFRNRLIEKRSQDAHRQVRPRLAVTRLPTMSPVISTSGCLRQSPNESPMTRW